jgi:hypothetical protein
MRRGDREKEKEKEKEKAASSSSSSSSPQPTNFTRAGNSMEIFLAMLADKDSMLRKVFLNLNVSEKYVLCVVFDF